MNVSNMEQVSEKVTIQNYDGSTVTFTEKGLKISDTLILSVYEAGVALNKFHYDQTGDMEAFGHGCVLPWDSSSTY